MALILTVNGHTPRLGGFSFLAPNATIVGDVSMGNQCSVWFNAVIRGDVNSISLGDKVNVQDGAIIHCTFQKYPTVIGNSVSIGHGAIIHGCEIKDNVLVGMGAKVMDGCIIHSSSVIAAGAVLLEGTIVPEGVIFAGIPAKKVKDVSEQLLQGEIYRIANNYVLYSSWYHQYNHIT